jgi:hypothetical protein
MSIIDGLKLVPLSYFGVVGVLVVLVMGITYLFWRLKGRNVRNEPENQPGSKWVKALRLIGFAIASFVLIVVVLMFFSSYQEAVSETKPAPSEVVNPGDLPFEVEEVAFQSEDGLEISGWFVPPQNDITIILLHGFGSNRLQMRWHAEVLTQAGFGVLIYDERASGESEGAYRSYGWEDPLDVGGAIRFLQDRLGANSSQIGIAGCSIGGQIALQGAAYYPEIGAVWADGPSTIRAIDIHPTSYNFLVWLIGLSNYVLDWTYERYLDIEAPPPMIEIIGEIAPRPIMLVGGGISAPITGSEAPQIDYYASYAGSNATVWIIEESYHCNGPQRRPVEYAARLVDFFEAAFK